MTGELGNKIDSLWGILQLESNYNTAWNSGL